MVPILTALTPGPSPTMITWRVASGEQFSEWRMASSEWLLVPLATRQYQNREGESEGLGPKRYP
jgi:hypothetical protein